MGEPSALLQARSTHHHHHPLGQWYTSYSTHSSDTSSIHPSSPPIAAAIIHRLAWPRLCASLPAFLWERVSLSRLIASEQSVSTCTHHTHSCIQLTLLTSPARLATPRPRLAQLRPAPAPRKAGQTQTHTDTLSQTPTGRFQRPLSLSSSTPLYLKSGVLLLRACLSLSLPFVLAPHTRPLASSTSSSKASER